MVMEVVVAVVSVPRPAGCEDDQRADRRVALHVGDVVALDSFRWSLETERLRERGQHRLGAAAVVISLDPQLFQLLLGGFGKLRHERPLAAALRHLDADRSSPTLLYPHGQQVTP